MKTEQGTIAAANCQGLANSSIPRSQEDAGLTTPNRHDIATLLHSVEDLPGNRGWVEHSFYVGDAAYRISTALCRSDYQIDPEKSLVLGYLHDIGKIEPFVGRMGIHLLNGYRFLRGRHYPEDYCSVCLTHSFFDGDPHSNLCSVLDPKLDSFIIDYVSGHTYSPEEDLISLCDLLCTYHFVTIDHRIEDAIARHGRCATTNAHITRIHQKKQKYDNLLGHDLYDLFPEIQK